MKKSSAKKTKHGNDFALAFVYSAQLLIMLEIEEKNRMARIMLQS